MTLWYGTSFWGDRPPTWWQGDFTEFLLLWKELWLTLTVIIIYFWYGWPFSASIVLANTTTWECLTHHYRILPNIFLDQRSYFTTMKVKQWARNQGIHWSYILHYPVITDRTVSWRYNWVANFLMILDMDRYPPIGCNIRLNTWPL